MLRRRNGRGCPVGRLTVAAGQQLVKGADGYLARFADIFYLLSIILGRNLFATNLWLPRDFVDAGGISEFLDDGRSCLDGSFWLLERIERFFGRVGSFAKSVLFLGKNGHAFAFLVGSQILASQVALGLESSLLGRVAVFCVFALVRPVESVSGVQVLP